MSNTNEAAVYNVLVVTCTETGYRYIGVRKETLETFRTRLIASVNGGPGKPGWDMQIVQSAVKYGEENHTYRSYGPYNKDQARKEKLRITLEDAFDHGTLCSILPRQNMPVDTLNIKLIHEDNVTDEIESVPTYKTIKAVKERNARELTFEENDKA